MQLEEPTMEVSTMRHRRHSAKVPTRYNEELVFEHSLTTTTTQDDDAPEIRYLCPEEGCTISANAAVEISRHYRKINAHPGKEFDVDAVITVPYLTFLRGKTKAPVPARTLKQFGHLLKSDKTTVAPKVKATALTSSRKRKRTLAKVPESPTPAPSKTSPTLSFKRQPSLKATELPAANTSRSMIESDADNDGELSEPPTLALPEAHTNDGKKLIETTRHQKLLLLDRIPRSYISDARNRHREEIGAVFVAARWTMDDKDEELQEQKVKTENMRNKFIVHILRQVRQSEIEKEALENELLRAEAENEVLKWATGEKDNRLEGPAVKKTRDA